MAGELVVLVELGEVVFEQAKYVLAAASSFTFTSRERSVGVFHDYLLNRRERQSPPFAAILRLPVLCINSGSRSFNWFIVQPSVEYGKTKSCLSSNNFPVFLTRDARSATASTVLL